MRLHLHTHRQLQPPHLHPHRTKEGREACRVFMPCVRPELPDEVRLVETQQNVQIDHGGTSQTRPNPPDASDGQTLTTKRVFGETKRTTG